MTKWNISAMCYALSDQGGQCHIGLPLTVYSELIYLFKNSENNLMTFSVLIHLLTCFHRASRKGLHGFCQSHWAAARVPAVHSAVRSARRRARSKSHGDLLQRTEATGFAAINTEFQVAND